MSLFDGLEDQLRGEADQRNPFVAPVYDEVVNDKAVYEKTALEGIGTFSLQHSGLNTLKRVLKKSKVFSEEDSDALIESIAKGEGKEGLQKLASRLTSRGLKKLGGKVQDLADKAKQFAKEKVQEVTGQQEEPSGEETPQVEEGEGIELQDMASQPENASNLAEQDRTEETTLADEAPDAPTADLSDLQKLHQAADQEIARNQEIVEGAERGTGYTEADGNLAKAKIEAHQQFKQDNPLPEEDIGEDAPETEGAVKDGLSDAVKSGLKKFGGDAEDVLKQGLSKVGEIEAVGGGPEDPLADVLAGVVGIGSLIGGLFRKTHHDSFVIPPMNRPGFEGQFVQKLG